MLRPVISRTVRCSKNTQMEEVQTVFINFTCTNCQGPFVMGDYVFFRCQCCEEILCKRCGKKKTEYKCIQAHACQLYKPKTAPDSNLCQYCHTAPSQNNREYYICEQCPQNTRTVCGNCLVRPIFPPQYQPTLQQLQQQNQNQFLQNNQLPQQQQQYQQQHQQQQFQQQNQQFQQF